MNDAPWVDGMIAALVLEAAAGLELKTSPPKHASGGSIYGCPACGATIRHTKTEGKNARGAIGVKRNGKGWRCFQCDASGSAIDLVAYSLCSKRYRDLHDTARTEVREWCQRWLRLDGTDSAPNTASRQWAGPSRPSAAAPAEPPPAYPPVAQVLDLWDHCERVDVDPAVCEYLLSRSLSPARIADLDLARALPVDGRVPDWARRWQDSGHRLIVPLFDAQADMRSVLARSLDRQTTRKSLAPSGFQRAGLSMQCGFARYIVRTAAHPDWWPSSTDLRVLVAEGEIDYLTWATEWSDSVEHAPATIGVVEGSWTPELAARVPDGAVVVIATHGDAAGEKYAARVIEALNERDVRLERWSAAA